MDSCNILQFLENKAILVTGATGLLGKTFIEKVLRIQPNVKKLYLLVRASDVNSAIQRLREEVLTKDLFRILRENLGADLDSFFNEKVVPVPGDTSSENLGVQDVALRDEIWRTIDLVVHCAATTKFDERYDVAFSVNTMGPLNVLNFAKKCLGIKMLLHVSTAYVSGEETERLIMEKPFCMGEVLKGTQILDINFEKKLIDEKMNEDVEGAGVASVMKAFGLERARLYGWPNTYVFTKAMGEMHLGKFKDNLPLVIIRPTIITSTYKEPFPGYTESMRTLDNFIVLGGKGKISFIFGNPETILDIIPADMVVNSMLVAMCAHADQRSDNVKIYHVGSSSRNPFRLSNFHDFATRYFAQNPWIDINGKPIPFPKPKVFSSSASFRRYMAFRYMIPLKVFGVVNAAFCHFFHSTYSKLYRTVILSMRLGELYTAYAFFKSIFDDTNTERLRMLAAGDGGFNLDPKCIDWEDYFLNVHIPGVIKYVMK